MAGDFAFLELLAPDGESGEPKPRRSILEIYDDLCGSTWRVVLDNERVLVRSS